MGYRSGAAFGDEVLRRAWRHRVRDGGGAARFDRGDPSSAHDAGLLHGSTRGVSAAAGDQDAGGACAAAKRKHTANRRVSEPTSEGDAGALPHAEGASSVRIGEEAAG